MSFFGQGQSNREPSFLRTFVPILLFTLLCGIVGPIFLVAYFLIDDPLTGWMFYAGLGITVADVVIGYFVAQSLYRRRHKRYNLEQNGRFGIGEVRSVDQTNVRINGQPMMKISLAISGDGIQLLQLAEDRKPTDMAHLMERIPVWQEALRQEIDDSDNPKPFFSDEIQANHGFDRDQRRQDDRRISAKKIEFAFFDRLHQVLMV